MHGRKTQIQMMETIAVLAVFFILVVLGFVFYSNSINDKYAVDNSEIVQLNAVKISQRISSLPELQCSQDNIILDNCIDELKLNVFHDVVTDNKIHYFDLFSFSRISVSKVYPKNGGVLLYDVPLEGHSYKMVSNIPISLWDPIKDKISFGVITIETYSK